MDDEDLKQRLLTRDTVFLGRSPKKVLVKLSNYGKQVAGHTEGDRTALAEALLCELRLFGIEVKKTGLAVGAAQRELNECDAEEKQHAVAIETAKQDIERLKNDLIKERQTRKRKEEYEALAHLVVTLPSVQESSKKLDGLRRDVAEKEMVVAGLEATLERKARHHDLLFDVVHDLTSEEPPFKKLTFSSS